MHKIGCCISLLGFKRLKLPYYTVCKVLDQNSVFFIEETIELILERFLKTVE